MSKLYEINEDILHYTRMIEWYEKTDFSKFDCHEDVLNTRNKELRLSTYSPMCNKYIYGGCRGCPILELKGTKCDIPFPSTINKQDYKAYAEAYILLLKDVRLKFVDVLFNSAISYWKWLLHDIKEIPKDNWLSYKKDSSSLIYHVNLYLNNRYGFTTDKRYWSFCEDADNCKECILFRYYDSDIECENTPFERLMKAKSKKALRQHIVNIIQWLEKGKAIVRRKVNV